MTFLFSNLYLVKLCKRHPEQIHQLYYLNLIILTFPVLRNPYNTTVKVKSMKGTNNPIKEKNMGDTHAQSSMASYHMVALSVTFPRVA